MSRIETRERAMELLFQIGFRNDPISDQIETFKENNPEVVEDEAYFLDIVYGVINSRDELDEKFVPFLKKWKLERLPQTDRIILEIAVYEILRQQGFKGLRTEGKLTGREEPEIV